MSKNMRKFSSQMAGARKHKGNQLWGSNYTVIATDKKPTNNIEFTVLSSWTWELGS